jgi:prepilin-type N-terminal cleavage/methylation domain-containing protein
MTLFFRKILIKKSRAFTLLETLVSLAILALVIVGPLAVISSSSGYARQTKDGIVATYLAEEAIELLQNQYASLYIFCKNQPSDPLCVTSSGETAGQIAWRLFKERLSSSGGQPSCFLKHEDGSSDNPFGCSYDLIDFSGDITSEPPVRYVSSDNECRYLAGASSTIPLSSARYPYAYVCKCVK